MNGPWTQSVFEKAKLLHEQIAWIVNAGKEHNASADVISARTSEIYRLLDELYMRELPLARTVDESDFVLHVEGPAIGETPRISYVTALFTNIKKQVTGLTKALSQIDANKKLLPHDIDLALAGIAPGSFYVGLKVPAPFDSGSLQPGVIHLEDPLYQATKEALRILGVVAAQVSEGDVTIEKVSAVVSDPAVRDAALVAVQRIAPSDPKRGVDFIGVRAKGFVGADEVRLTSESREDVRQILKRPITSGEEISIEGTVREIDLDANRFEIRRIENYAIQDIRCIYQLKGLTKAKQLLGKRTRVVGRIERNSAGLPRLMHVESVSVWDHRARQFKELAQ